MPVFEMILVVVFAVTIFILVYCRFTANEHKTTGNNENLYSGSGNIQASEELYLTRLVTTNPWWTGIRHNAQLQLAIELAEKALPVWEQYAAKEILMYKENANESGYHVNKDLLCNSLAYLKNNFTLLTTPGKTALTGLKKYQNEFIGPVMALADGYWKLPYVVKKVFYAVYEILNGILDYNEREVNFDFSNAITDSLDAIDIAGLLTEKQVRELLEPYKNDLPIQSQIMYKHA